MKIKSANTFLLLALFCASFLSYSQDDGLTLLKDDDDKLIKFENHYFEALKYKAIGNYTRAITELEICQQLFKDDVAVDFEFSKNYFALNKYLEAALYIEKSLKSEPENFWFLVQAKKVYLKQFNYTKAIAIQQKMIKQKPVLADDLVLIYIQANEQEKARNLLDDLTSQGITSSKLRHYQKIVDKRKVVKKPKKKAVSEDVGNLVELKKVYESNKDFKILKEVLSQEFAANNFDEIYNYSLEGLELFPAQPYVYLMYGKALINQKKYNKAIDVLESGLDFLIDDITQEKEFYQDLILCYTAISDEKLVNKYQQKLNNLKK
ncbi:MAG: hypothetical protein COB73_03860 [Flavobacteriaceae bacterium]|nr:MAG: hypothetical protein COB73_03860 [Flavobacteriaceae bacterium]